MDPQGAHPQSVDAVGTEQRSHRQKSGKILGNDAGQRHPRHVHAEDNDEKQVQRHVDDPRQRQVEERLFGVPHRAEHGVTEVEDRQRGHTQEVDAEVEHRPLHEIGLGAQQGQKGPCQSLADAHDRKPHQKTENGRGVDCLTGIFLVPRAHEARHQHVDTRPHTHQNAGVEHDHGGGGAHRA